MTESSTISVLFVCLGNICRSPLAEGVFTELVEEEGLSHLFEIDSAGTGAYHVGESPDPRSVEVAQRNGIRLDGSARQVTPPDMERFDYVVAMDRSNLRNLEGLGASGSEATVALLRSWDPEAAGDDRDVPDPYYGGAGGFDRVYDMVARSCEHLLAAIRDEEGI